MMSLEELSGVSDTFKLNYEMKRSQKDSETAKTSSRSLGDMIDMDELSMSGSQTKPVEWSVKSQSAGYSSLEKPPLPPSAVDSNEASTSAPPERKRSRHKKTSPPQKRNADKTSPPQKRKADKTSPPQKRKADKISPPLKRKTDSYDYSHPLDSSQNGSPEGSLQELHPFLSPEAGLRESLQSLDAEDWSAKVEGMMGLRRLAMYHSDILLPRLHVVIIAVVKEVRFYNINYIMFKNSTYMYILTSQIDQTSLADDNYVVVATCAALGIS